MTPWDVSVLIPARNEEWLGRTVADVLAHAEARTQVVVVLDGAWPVEPLECDEDERVTLVRTGDTIGQRAATNLAARVAAGRYVMKLDAHCSLDQGFDVKLLEPYEDGTLGPDVTTIPAQRGLHVWDWVCQGCGARTYQADRPSTAPCVACRAMAHRREVIWLPKGGTTTSNWYFDHLPKFRYGRTGNQEEVDGLRDIMSSLGACFFMPRARYLALGGLDEASSSWGSVGIEVACKSWLSGGRQVVSKRTWFAHFFRVGHLAFPYPWDGGQAALAYHRRLWYANAWPGQVRPLSWLVGKFAPLGGWHEEANAADLAEVQASGTRFCAAPAVRTRPRVGVAYYTDNRPDPEILQACREQLRQALPPGAQVVAVSIDGPVPGPWRNLQLPLARGYETMFRQILAALEALDTDVVFLAEHDVLYHASHFEFRPARADCYYYNRHVWKQDWATGRAVHYLCDQTSQLCADRGLLLAHYRARVARVAADGFTRRMGFEPGTRKVRHGGVDDVDVETWMSAVCNVDIRHDRNLTETRWRQDQFRRQSTCQGWQEADTVPGWEPRVAL